MNTTRKPAVVLVSGGMDSAVVLAIAREAGFDVHALSVRYGQRHTSELDAADRVSNALGAIDIAGVDPRVSRVLDIKTPDSAEVERNLWDNLSLLTPRDQVKFVICSRADFDWAKDVVAEHRLHEVCDVLFSPSASQLPARELADWIVAEKLPVRFQMQLHKLLWNDEPGR